jgi:hypothetical protein
MEFEFTAEVIEWRGPAPYYYAVLPDGPSEAIHEVAGAVTYGWGVIPVDAWLGDTHFTTSLFPRDGGYLLPLKDAVRRPLAISVGNRVAVRMSLAVR